MQFWNSNLNQNMNDFKLKLLIYKLRNKFTNINKFRGT